MPQITLKGLSIFGKEHNIHKFLYEKEGKTILQLDYSQNFFQLNFMAIDYINGNNYSFIISLKNEQPMDRKRNIHQRYFL